MFCTVCAEVNPPRSAACIACGSPLRAMNAGDIARTRMRRIASVALAAIPVLALAAIIAAAGMRHLAANAAEQRAYTAAAAAWDGGDYLAALDGFAAAGEFADAPARHAAADAALAPDRAAAALGVDLIARGDYRAAIDSLLPAARRSPLLGSRLGSVTDDLAEARRLETGRLLQDADAAVAGHDWLRAEGSLRAASVIAPADDTIRDRLAALGNERGPLLFTRDKSLTIARPDGQDASLLLDGYESLLPVWSPDRSRVAFFSIEYADPETQIALYLLDLASGHAERLAGFASAHAAPVWSPDGRYIAYTSIEAWDPVSASGLIGIRLADLPQGRIIDVTGSEHTLAFNPAFSADGQTLYFVSKDRSVADRPLLAPGDVYGIRLADLDGTRRFDNLTRGAATDVWSIHPAPKGRMMLLYSLYAQSWYEPPRSAIRLLDPASGAVGTIAGSESMIGAPVWSPDGSRFAWVDADLSVSILPAGIDTAGADSATRRILSTATLSQDITWSPDGTKLVAAAMLGSAPSLLADLSGTDPVSVETPLTYDAESPYFGPPQWAPVTQPLELNSFGTGLDSSE